MFPRDGDQQQQEMGGEEELQELCVPRHAATQVRVRQEVQLAEGAAQFGPQ